MTHSIPPTMRTEAVDVSLVGCGGTGSQMLSALARIHVSLRSLGHNGFRVTVFDPDEVTEANIGRQLFSPSDIGRNKAVVMVNRINAFFGLGWKANPSKFEHQFRTGIVVGCVDSARARVEIASKMAGSGSYWLDLGNDAKTGQVILGQFAPRESERKRVKEDLRLPTVLDLFPSLHGQKETNTPSCSLAGALVKQDLFVNQLVATWGAHLLWQMFRQPALTVHGYFVNLDGFVSPLPIETDAWLRFGYRTKADPLRKIVKFIKRAKGLLDWHKVKLECGHIVRAKGEKKARCNLCGVYPS